VPHQENLERCLQAEQCRDGGLLVLSCRDAALDQWPVIFLRKRRPFGELCLLYTRHKSKKTLGAAMGNSAISTALLSKLARSWPGFVPCSSLHVLCIQSVCGQCKGLPPLHHRTAAFAGGVVGVLTKHCETNNEEVVQQLSKCRWTNQAVRNL